MNRKPVIIPFDGIKNFSDLQSKMQSTFANPDVRTVTSYIKFNDILYGSGGCLVLKCARQVLEDLGLGEIQDFWDLKLSDTSGTNINILEQYKSEGLTPGIVTIRENCSKETFAKVRALFPTAMLAVVSVLTDTSAEECRIRYGMTPLEKIIKDVTAITLLCPNCIDAVVCSPLEVETLKKEFPSLKFIVPGIRDKWMASGQQARYDGVRSALENGADFVVMGAQMNKGNPEKKVTAGESVTRTIAEIRKAQVIVPDDHLQTLKNFDAYYESPRDDQSQYIGPLVGYAKKDAQGKNYVGFIYYNLAKIETHPRALDHFANQLADKIRKQGIEVDVVLGAPMGGIALATMLSQKLKCRLAFAEKEVVTAAIPKEGIREEAKLVIARHDIEPADRVLVVEDLCNNLSTTGQLDEEITGFGALMVGVACIVNRSFPFVNEYYARPVVSVLDIPTEQFTQDDLRVATHVTSGNLVLKPKKVWKKLKDAMEKRVQTATV